ncbi:MAG: arylsulfatase [Saprospiraceae bacterium]|nr:arylsulfatase [Saprospiraceae bacterium]
MKYVTFIAAVLLMTACASESDRPNVIYILADDLGYGELGCYGQEIIETPHLDALAASGMRFTQHYSGAPVCAPARCVLMTGQHIGHAYIRGNDEWGERGLVWDYQEMYDNPQLEGQRPLPDTMETLAQMLQDDGYRTGMVGKWGLGAPHTSSIPTKKGFDYFLGYNCQRQAHTLYPMHLWRNEEKFPLDNKFVNLHANLSEGADPQDPASYADFSLNEYAPTVMHEGALNFIEEAGEEPFFLYYATPIPHVPLQAPQRWVEYYQKIIGPEEPHTANSYYPCLAPRATYAAMVSYLDEQVGELVAKLKEMGQYENTLIIFSSDNGPSFTGGTDSPYFSSAGPFKSEYGWGKGFVHEGGIRVPMIASWPAKISPGTTSDLISGFQDVMPTVAEACGVRRKKPSDGISMIPELTGIEDQVEHPYLYWEFPSYGGQQAIRMGKWKGIRKNMFQKRLRLDLFDLEKDPQEVNNLASEYPHIVSQMLSIMEKARTEPSLDRFKFEVLGDVKQGYLDAQERLHSLQEDQVEVSATEGYFEIVRSTGVVEHPAATDAIERMQERLDLTSGYRLRSRKSLTGKSLVFEQVQDMSADRYQCTVDSDLIEIKAGGTQGFEQAVEKLMAAMDGAIWEDHRMHNPRWMIAAGTITNQ